MILLVTAFVAILNITKFFDNEESSAASSEMCFSKLATYDEDSNLYNLKNYESVTTFVIETKKDLKIFAKSAWISSDENEQTFKNKIVRLNANLNLEGESFDGIGTNLYTGSVTYQPVFCGTFDGNGCTIENFSLTGANSHCQSETEGIIFTNTYTCCYFGFFGCTFGATTIKNLRLNNFNILGFGPNRNHRVYAGGLIGYAQQDSDNNKNTTISNCSIENFNGGLSNNSPDKEYVAGVVCTGYVSIENCYISGVDNSTGANEVTNFNIVGPFSNNSSATISKCVINNYCSGQYGLSDGQKSVSNTYVYWNPTDNYPSEGIWNSAETSSVIDGIDKTVSTCFNSLSSVSSEGGYISNIDKIWYVIPEYNNGWPYLRQFISDWHDVYFASCKPDDTIKVPQSALGQICENVNGQTVNKLSIAYETISAKEYGGYTFADWEATLGTDSEGNNTSCSCTATYNKNQYIISFSYPQFEDSEIIITPQVNGENLTGGWAVNYSDKITISITHSSIGTIISYKIGSRLPVTYTVDAKYTLDFTTLNGERISSNDTISDYGASDTIVVLIPVLKLKQYNASFS